MKRALITGIYCKNCPILFYVNINLKRNKNRTFCSAYCAKLFSDRLNKKGKEALKFKQYYSKVFSGINNPFYGRKHSNKAKLKISIANKGKLIREKSPCWIGGLKYRPDCYIRDSYSDNYIYRIIMGVSLKRKLTKNGVVHHINGNPSDNGLANLQVLTNSEYRRLHRIGYLKDKHG